MERGRFREAMFAMPIKVLNSVLLIAAVVGGVLAYRVGQQHRQLLAELRRLEGKVGRLPVDDPSKVYVRALETGEALHFAWRVYHPANFAPTWHCDAGSSFWSASRGPCEFIARVRFREDDQGVLNVFTKEDSGSSGFSLGNRQLADLLRGRWGEIQVEQAGSHEIAVFEADEVVTLLRLTLPDDLKQEAARTLNKHLVRRFQAALFEMRFGSDKAFERAKAGGPAAK